MNDYPETGHAEGCKGCDTGDETHACHGCGHWRVDIHDYSHGYYCTDCVLAISRWRKAEADMQKWAADPRNTERVARAIEQYLNENGQP